MGKYDEAIGGGKIIVDIQEILNEEAADKVDKKIKTQKAELEKPVKVTVEVDDKSIGKLKQLTEAVKKNSDNLQQAMQSGQNVSELSDYIQTHKQLERQIKAVTKEVKNNRAAVSASKQALINAKKIIDQISVSIEKSNGTDYLDRTVSGATQAVSAISKFQTLLGDLGKKYGNVTFSNVFGGIISSFKAIDESNASQVYDALIAKDREYQAQLEEESKVRERIAQEVKAYAEATKYIYKNGEPSQDILKAYTSYWEKVSAGAMSAADAVKAFEQEWSQLGGAVDYQQKKQIDEIRALIRNQKEWLKYLEQSLNPNNFKTSGKREATQQLRDLTNRLVSARRNNYQDDSNSQYNRQMIEVAWAQGYREAQRQNVAQSTLNRYRTDALGSYDDNLRVLQEQYDFRKKLLGQYEEELNKINQVTSATEKQIEVEKQNAKLAEFAASKNAIYDTQDALAGQYREANAELEQLVSTLDHMLTLSTQLNGLKIHIADIEKTYKSNATALRKNIKGVLGDLSEELANLIGGNFVAAVKNGFKGVKTPDIIAMIRNSSGFDSEEIAKLRGIDWFNIDFDTISDLQDEYPMIKTLGQIYEKRQQILDITKQQTEAQWQLWDVMSQETEYNNSLISQDEWERIEQERKLLRQQQQELDARRKAEAARQKLPPEERAKDYKLADTTEGLYQQVKELATARDWANIDSYLEFEELYELENVLGAIISKTQNLGEAFRTLSDIFAGYVDSSFMELAIRDVATNIAEKAGMGTIREQAGFDELLDKSVFNLSNPRPTDSICTFVAKYIVGDSEVIQAKRAELEAQFAELDKLSDQYESQLRKREDFLFDNGFFENSRKNTEDDELYAKILAEKEKIDLLAQGLREKLEQIDTPSIQLIPTNTEDIRKQFEETLLAEIGEPVVIPAVVTFDVNQPFGEVTNATGDQTKAIEANTQATEKNAQAKKKASKIKVRELSRAEYDDIQEKYQEENGGGVEALEETVDIIHEASKFGTKFSVDLITSCKKAETAIRRLFSAIDPEKYPALAGWKESLLESVQNGYFSEKETYNGMFTGGYSWEVEQLDEDRFYVFLNLLDVAKDKEAEHSAYLQEKCRKRDEGLQRESELVHKLYSKYEELAALRKDESSYDEVGSAVWYQKKLEYYEKEKVLLQDILNLEDEIRKIPGTYKAGTNFRDINRAYWTEKVTRGSLENNAFYIKEYSKQLNEYLDARTTPSGQIGMFKGMADPIFEAVDATEELKDAMQEVAKIPGQISFDQLSNIGYHAGVLSDINHTQKSFSLGHVSPNRSQSVFGGLTGLYTTEDLKEFIGNEWHGAPITGIDYSYYKLFDARTDELASKLNEFFNELNGTIYGYIECFDAGELVKLTDVKSVEELYSSFQDIFHTTQIDFEKFSDFIHRAQSIVNGYQFTYANLPAIDQGIGKAGVGRILQGAPEDIFNSDSFQTQLMKMLGYEGVDLRGTKYNGTYSGGTVVFTVKPESLIDVDANWSDVMRRNGYEVSERDLEIEKKRRQLAFETAKAYSQPTGQVERAEEQLKIEQQITVEKEKQNELIAMHGTSTKNLLTALDQGAFSSPSIALTKPDVYPGGYGDATVVFKKSAIDPALNPANKIYGVDAYTPTHPSFGYELNEEALAKAAERTGIALDDLRRACDGAYESVEDAAKALSTSTGLGDKLQEAFIKERGIVIQTAETDEQIKGRFHVNGEDIHNLVRDFIAQDNISFDAIVNNDQIQQEYFAAIDKYVSEYNAQFVGGFERLQIPEKIVADFKEGIQRARLDDAVYREQKDIFEHDRAVIRGEKKVIDVAAYNNEVQRIIAENRQAYNTYVREIFGSFMVKPNVIGANGQRFDRTPEGIAEAMSTYGGKGALYDQNAFMRRGVDLQAFIIAASKTYESLDEVILDMERLQKDATGTHTLSDTGYSIAGITSLIAQANKVSDEEAFDKILHAVDGNSTAEAIGEALANSGLVVENSTVEKIATLAQEALKVPTRYFEAKPQRTLSLEDIDYVAIPKDSVNASELRTKLQEKGIKYVEHTSTDKDSRLAALQAGMQQNWATPAEQPTIPVQPSVESGTVEAAIQESTGGSPVEVPVVPVVEQTQSADIFETPSGQLAMFDGMTDSAEQATESVNKLGEAIQETTQIPGQISIFDHLGEQEEAARKAAEQAERQTEAERHVAEAAAEAAEQIGASVDGENNAIEIVERNVKDALQQLRSAKNNDKALINFEGAFTPDNLLEQFQNFAKNISGLDLDVGKINIHGDTARVQLYNDELKVTVDQIWRLKEASEEAGQTLEYVDQSFGQNVKALNANNFDVDGVRARAEASVEKLRSSLHGLEYDLTDLENAAKSINSQDDFNKFNNQLKAAQDNIQAIKNSTVSKNSLNPLANMQRDMQNANIELDTMELKLQKIGDVDGAKDAARTIEDMRRAVEQFNAATNAESQQSAYNEYSNLRSKFKAQLEYLNVKKSAPSDSGSGPNNIEEYYQRYFDTFKKINDLDTQINKLKLKDGGSGIYSGMISQLENEKSSLLQKIDQIGAEVDQEFQNVFSLVGDNDKIDILPGSFLDDTGSSGTFLNFLNDARVQSALTTDQIEKLVEAIQKSRNIKFDFVAGIANQINEVSQAQQKLQSISDPDSDSSILSRDTSEYQQAMQNFSNLSAMYATFGQDVSKWSAAQIAAFSKAATGAINYSNAIAQAAEKEAQYFAGKKIYQKGATIEDFDTKSSGTVQDDATQENTKAARQQLEDLVNEFSHGKGIITDFTTAANGVSKVSFSIFDEAAGKIRTFNMELGKFNNKNFALDETSMKSFTTETDAANKSLKALQNTMLELNGVEGAGDLQRTLNQKMQELNNALNAPDASTDAGQTRLKNLATEADKTVKSVAKLQKEWVKTQAALENKDLTQIGQIDKNGDIQSQMENLISTTYDAKAAVTGFDSTTNTLTYTLTNADGTVTTMTAHMSGLNGVVTTQQGATKKLVTGWQEFTGALGGSFKSIIQYLGRTFSVMGIVSQLKQGFSAVKEIDAALTELKKVTDETEGSYQRFLSTASQTAGKIGSTVSDFTEATSNFARLGYSMEESAKMAETAIVYKNVADGLDTVEESTESIISTMKAFGIESDDTMSIIDRFNEVGNNFSITSAGIGDALQRSASALYEAGNTIDESIGLVTAANSVIQNPEQVGTALKTLALRLRGTKTELEEAGEDVDGMAENTSQLQAKLKALTHGKVDIMVDADTFKSTTQILREMADAWEDMTDIERSSALELMGGKRQANILASVIKNFDTVEEVIKTSQNSEGSALKENEVYLNSIQGKLDQLSNSTQTMWMNFMRSDVVKFLIDVASALVKVIDKVGLLNAAVAAFAAKTAFKSEKFGILNWGKNKTNGLSSTATQNTAEANAQNLDTAATQKNTDATNANIEAEQRSAQASNNSAAADNAEAQATANAAAADSAEANASNMEASADSAEAASSSAAASADAMETASSATSTSADIAEAQASMQAAAADAAEQIASEGAAMGDATEAAVSGIAAAADAAEGASSGISTLISGLQSGSKAFKLFNAAAIGAVALIASMAISAAIEYFYDLAHASEKAAEAAAEAINSYQNTQKTLNSQRSTVKELASSYEELSKGVDVNTNKNINLSTSSYQKYLDVCNDIADMYPHLVTGFDAQGNAILSLKGNVDELTNAYLEAAQANRQALIAGGDDVFDTFKNTYDNDGRGLFDGDPGLKQQLAAAQKLQEAINSGSISKMKATYLDLLSFNQEALYKVLDGAGIEKTDFYNVWSGEIYTKNMTKSYDKLSAFIKTTQAKINTSTNDVKTLMDAYLGEDIKYTTLGQDAKSTINQIISGLNADFVSEFESAGDLWAWVKTNLVDAFSDSNLGQSISDSLSDAFDLQEKLKSGDVDIQGYKDRMLSFVDKIKNSNLAKDVQEQILQMFDIDWSKDDSVGENIDQMITYAQNIVDQNTKDKVLTLSYSDLQIINSEGFEVPTGVLLTWDQLQAKIKETKIAMTKDFTTDNFADYAESISAISSNISTYQEALEKLDSGTFTLSDFMDLISEFPDLADGVDIASKSFNGLSKNLKKAIRNSPDDLVDELKDLRDQLVEAGKSTDSIDALINSIENMPTDAVAGLTEEYITLTDQINAAKKAQNELQEAMNENPNEGYETRGEAIEQMKTLMEEGKIGSESELWSIAKEFGFTYESADSINANAEALYNFIAAREAWYATDDDGNYTYEGIESFIKYVQDKQSVLDKYGATWTYEDGVFNFDLDNKYWEDFAKDIGLTSEEFYDLMMQIGQFFDINWQDADDLIWYMDQINKGTESASEKFDSVEQAVKSFLESNGYSEDLLELSVDDDEFEKLPEEIQKVLTEYYELKAKFEADPLGITYQLEKDSKTNTTEGLTDDSLKALNQLTTTITDTDTGVTWLSLEDLSKNAKEAGMDMDALGERMRELVDVGKVIDLQTTAKDPLGLKSMQADAQSTITYLQALGIAAQGLDGAFTINLPSFIDLMVAAGWGSEQIQAYINSLNSEGYTFTYTTEENETKTLDVNTEEGQAKIDELVAKSNELTDTETLTLNLDGTAEGAIAAIKSDLSTLTSSPYNITVNIDETGIKLSNPNVSATVNYNAGTQEEPKDLNADVNYDLGAQEIPENETADVNYELGTQEAPEDKTATVTYTIEYETGKQDNTNKWADNGSGGKKTTVTRVNGTAHVDGTAHKSGSWGAPTTETALVGELGPEMVVRNGRWFTVGDNGAEFTDIQKGDIIFNHKQTEDLLSKGYVTGRGKAFAEGNAYISGGSFRQTFAFSDTEGKELSNAGSKLSKAADDISKSADELSDDFKEIFDWIEVRIEEITEDIDLKSAKLENAVGSTKQNAIIDDMIALNKKLYDNLTAGAAKYDEYAAKLLEKVPAEYRKAAQDGSIAIESFTGTVGEEALEAIENYREWAQKGADLTQQAEETLTETANLAKQAIDNIASDYENKSSIPNIKIEQLEAYNALIETTKGAESAKVYQAMIEENNKNIKILEQQRDEMQAELNAQVEAGNIKKYSQAWYDAINDIAAVDTEIIELTTDTANYQDTINELHWEHFDNLISRFEAISDEANNLIDILGSKDLVDKDSAEWTDEGITALGLYAQQMEVAEMQAKKYEEEIKYLNENWKSLGYTEQEYVEKLEELKSGQYDAIRAYNDTKDAIVDLNQERIDAIKDGIEKEIDAYEELIEKKKELLDSEKDLFDFQKSIQEQEKNIAKIERQLAALAADNSASARAKRAQLEAELAEAQADLQDKYYERSISDQQDALDKELESFQEEKNKEIEGWDEYLENTELVVSDSLATIQANTDVVYQTLKDMGKEYGLSIAESLTSPWKDGESAIQSYSETFGFSMSSTVEELKEVAAEYKKVMAEIEKYGKEVIEQVNENVETYQGGNKEPKAPKQKEPEKTIKVGGKINAGSAKIYDYAGDKTGEKQYYSKDPIYKVLAVNGNWVQVRYHKLTKGITGWFKKSDVKAYAKGTTGVVEDQLALIDELGEELVLGAKNGRLAYLSKGSGVIPADLTSNLMEWGELDPSMMLDQNRPVINNSYVTNNNLEINMNFGEIVHVDTVTNDTIPNLTKAIDKQLDKYMRGLNAEIRKYAR